MREVIQLQVGKCGNQVGERFWQDIMQEHGIDGDGNYIGKDPLQKYRIDVFFKESKNNLYVPRTVLIDTEPSGIDSLRAGVLRKVLKDDNVVVSHTGAGNNWAKGNKSLGIEILDSSIEIIRREAEACDCLQGIQLAHSLGGGTGSGFGSLLLSELRDEYSDRMFCTFSVFPSFNISNTVVEPYNTVLAINDLIEFTDAVNVLDNEALGQINRNILKIGNPKFDDFNKLISKSMAGVTCSIRYPGQLNSDLRKLCVNLTPFPRLHFFTSSVAPLHNSGYICPSMKEINAITNDLLNWKYCMCRGNQEDRKYLTASILYRGKVSTRDVDEQIYAIQNSMSESFVEWIPHNIKSSVCDYSPEKQKIIATFLGNSTGVVSLLREINSQMAAMVRRKAFLHWYLDEGLELMELQEAEHNLYDLVQDYQQHAFADLAEDEEDYEEG